MDTKGQIRAFCVRLIYKKNLSVKDKLMGFSVEKQEKFTVLRDAFYDEKRKPN